MFQPIPMYETNVIQLHFFTAVVLISITVVWLDLSRGAENHFFTIWFDQIIEVLALHN